MAILAPDATIRDLADSLRDPESYVCGVLRNMHVWARQRGQEGFVTIGVTGRGMAPHDFIGHTWMSDDCELFVSAYNETSHERLPYRVSEVDDVTWSIRPMAHDEVRKLLGEIRSLKRVSKVSSR